MYGNNEALPRPKPGWRTPTLAFAWVVLMAGTTMAEEMLVVGSSVPGLAPGEVAPTGSALEIPRDSQVTLVAPSGGVLKIEGPWSGRIDTAADEGPGLIQRLYALFQMPDRRARFGATRSLSRCVTIDLDQDDHVCVAEPTCVTFHTEGPPPAPVSMTGPDGTSVSLAPSVGAGSWRWPSDLVQRSGAYGVQVGESGTPATLEVHLQPSLPTRAHEIAWMGEVGCVRQAQEALAGLIED